MIQHVKSIINNLSIMTLADKEVCDILCKTENELSKLSMNRCPEPTFEEIGLYKLDKFKAIKAFRDRTNFCDLKTTKEKFDYLNIEVLNGKPS